MKAELREELSNYLLNHCFVIGALESTKEAYFHIVNNEEEFQVLFRPLGYSVVINRTIRVAHLVNNHNTGRIELDKYQSILLLILRLLYVEKRESLAVNENMVIVSVEDIQAEYNKLSLPRKLDQRMLEDALRFCKRYNLAIMLDRLEDTASRIQILPSVMLAMPEQSITKAYEQTKDFLVRYQKQQREVLEDEPND